MCQIFIRQATCALVYKDSLSDNFVISIRKIIAVEVEVFIQRYEETNKRKNQTKDSLLLVKERNKTKKPFANFYYKTSHPHLHFLRIRPIWKTSDPDRTVTEERQTGDTTVQIHSVVMVCKISGLTALPTPITRPEYPKITRIRRKENLHLLHGDSWIQI